MRSWGYQEILAAGGCNKAFQAVVIIIYIVLLDKVKCGGVGAHGGEEVGGGYEDGGRGDQPPPTAVC